MLLSIIVPVYKVEKFLAKCLDSALEQDLPADRYEIVMVNDGSPDGSLAIAESYARKHANVSVISQQNQGLSGARNTGVAHAKGKFVFFLDSDDYIAPNVLGSMMRIIERNDLDFLGFELTHTPERDYSVAADFSPYLGKDLAVYAGPDYMAAHNYMANAVWYIVERQLLLDAKLAFEPGRLLEDGMYTAELLLNVKRGANVPVSVYRYYTNPDSIVSNFCRVDNPKMFTDTSFIVRKFNYIISEARKKNAPAEAIRRLHTTQEAYLFFHLVRMVRGNVPFSRFDSFLDEAREIGAYPMRNFIGVDYNTRRLRFLTAVFNNKFLLRLTLGANSIFRVIK